MSALAQRLRLMERLPRTWSAFFERHGNFTAAQVATIPYLLDGYNVMLCAPTASGKTEAALAPLIERYSDPVPTRRRGTAILYVTPTRALVNDLATRLTHPLETLSLRLGVKTGDRDTFRARRTPDVLITTPESLDSLLTTQARLLIHLRAVVIDEIHLFDGSPRGDHLRVLLRRLRHIRAYAYARRETGSIDTQYVALSATVPLPAHVAGRYFEEAQVVEVGGRAPLAVDWVALDPNTMRGLHAQLRTFRARGWNKALVFCNSRREIETYAAAVRTDSPFGNAVYVHYSNLDPQRRREIEQEFGASDAAICFASTTLELGIDIGSIDVVLLIGPPGSQASFLQRIGRGNRRSGPGGRVTRIMCLYRSALERLLFEILCTLDTVEGQTSTAFRPAVAIQQIFSLLKQSPTAAVRLPELMGYFENLVTVEDLQAIIGRLVELRYLADGRPGEWRAGEHLQQLFDEQGSPRCSISIFGNIQFDAGQMFTVRDQHTQRIVAQIERRLLQEPAFTLEGRPVSVEWQDGNALWVQSAPGLQADEKPAYRSGRQFLDRFVLQHIPRRLGLEPGAAPLIARNGSWAWFHWLGEVYGRATMELLRYTIAVHRSPQPGLCVYLPEDMRVLPVWTHEQVQAYLEDTYQAYEPMLALGPFHSLLPVSVRRHAVTAQFDIKAFLAALATLHLVLAPAEAQEDLLALLEEKI